jgi:hypothetical protein
MAILQQLRLEVIVRKYLSNGVSVDLIVHKLMFDPYVQEKEQKLGKEKVIEMIYNLVKRIQTEKKSNIFSD